ncbi:MAG: hypothetical protein ABJF65_00280 [Reichenbachiella sp.]|uniref:hypothetical protein n=1 Tax=Reichenbachiella sp. TaxID=2184521 RepID=UPI0032634D9F
MDFTRMKRKGYQVHYFFGRDKALPLFLKIICTPSGKVRFINSNHPKIKPLNDMNFSKIHPFLIKSGYSYNLNKPSEVFSLTIYFHHPDLVSKKAALPPYFSIYIINETVEYSNNSSILRSWRHLPFQDLQSHFTGLGYQFETIK